MKQIGAESNGLNRGDISYKAHEVNDTWWNKDVQNSIGVDKCIPYKSLKYSKEDSLNSKIDHGCVSVYDVAVYILKRIKECSTMKLHKLLYYCQAWSLVWDEKSLFPEQIEAWANGPVVRELFNFHKGWYSVSYQNMTIGNEKKLSEEQIDTIDSVLQYYGDKPAQWLIDLTHTEAPWKNARRGYAPTERGNTVITNDSMAEYYSSLS
ncbi:DUF4065 domain-containing protein [Parabacteroides sp. W1-Q-101]|uniref:Panacea domain-containing protein n=1 Tax=Parabacteroides TaxID=375288 RepID=UPI00202F1945|nr:MULTISPECIES: type II toxin-antitoxin system antitoxin SocA domain-containing protein [Parabacteroides]MCM0721606.1 DUF4065 domain-containing protein [Parabacteroides sp. W1-Q-101]